MKCLLPVLMAVVLFSCSKEVNSPPVSNDAKDQAQSTDAKKQQARKNKPQTDTYTYNYVGDSGEGFDATFDPWTLSAGETLVSWKATITRKVSGNTVLTNTSGKQNTSKVDVSRYTIVTMGGMNIASWPNAVVQSFNHTIGSGKTQTVPINATITDVINSTSTTLHNLDGDGSVPIVWHFDDLVSVFKANCNNNSTLEDNVTVTVVYTYVVN